MCYHGTIRNKEIITSTLLHREIDRFDSMLVVEAQLLWFWPPILFKDITSVMR